MELLESLAQGGIEGIHRAIPLGGHLQGVISVTDGNGRRASRGRALPTAAEVAMVSLKLKERIVAAEFLPDKQFKRGIGRLELIAL